MGEGRASAERSLGGALRELVVERRVVERVGRALARDAGQRWRRGRITTAGNSSRVSGLRLPSRRENSRAESAEGQRP